MSFALSEYSTFLWLLVLLPLVPLVSYFGFGKRLWLSSLMRIGVCAALILALADIQWVRETKDTDVLVVVDQSESLGADGKHRAWQMARKLAAQEQSNDPSSKRLGIVVFGKDAVVENPLSEGPKVAELPESAIDGSQSNIAKALKFAGALFDRVANRRIVLVSDGEATDREIVQIGHQLGEQGIEIDVARVAIDVSKDVSVESIDVPSRNSVDTPIQFAVRLRNKSGAKSVGVGADSQSVSGRLVVQRIQGSQTQIIADGPVTLEKELEVIPLRDTPTDGGLVVYEARFVADDPTQDTYAQNNVGSGICEVIDKGRVLVITTSDQVAPLEERLAFLVDHGIHCDVRADSQSFTNIADLILFDTVMFVNTPRMEFADGLPILRFSNEQVADLKSYVHDFGGGVVMVGGPKSMGAGHWMNTPLEEAMPVRFQVDNEKIVSVGALALVIDKSGSMSGDSIAMSKAAALQSVSMLSDSDYVGIYPFDSQLIQSIPMQKVGSGRGRIQGGIRRIGADGGTNMTPALDAAYRDLLKNNASLKHVIVLTDGQTAGGNFESQARDMLRRGITTSAVAVGTGADSKLLQSIAKNGGGQFYQVNNPSAIPRIFMKETRMMSKPLVRDFDQLVPVIRNTEHEMVQGMASPLPGISGIVLTTIRENVLADQILRSEQPESPNDTLLASWQFGSGRSAVWTTDLGERWAGQWRETGNMDQLLVQTLRWVRRQQLKHNHSVQVSTVDNETRVALQWDDAIANVPNTLQCVVTGIDNDVDQRLTFERLGPRRFEATLDSLQPGNYALAVDTGSETGVITQGFSVRDNQEFTQRSNSLNDLVEIASVGRSTNAGTANAKGVAATIESLRKEYRWLDAIGTGGAGNAANDPASLNQIGASEGRGFDLFRPTVMKDRSLSSTWPLFLLMAGVTLLCEIAGRKLGWDRLVAPDRRVRNKMPRMTTTFEANSPRIIKPRDPSPKMNLGTEENLTYTGRLLKTKNESKGKR